MEDRFAAIGVGLDLTKRGMQGVLKKQGLPWERAKAFDGSALFSDFVEIDGVSDKISMTLHIDDQIAQEADYSLMLYKPDQILTEL